MEQASGPCPIPTTGAPKGEQAGWCAMYVGAFIVLGIYNVEAARDLAALTRSDVEANHVIHMLRDGRDGDRVWPVQAWLRTKRAQEVTP